MPELVRWPWSSSDNGDARGWPWSSSDNGDARGARAMAVELERQWQRSWSSSDGGGARAMAVELV